MKYVHKNQNHRALCYYAMNNHMYLVKNKKLIKSMVKKAKSIEHTMNTSLLEHDEIVNHFNGKEIYVNQSIHDIKTNHCDKINIIFMYSRDIKNINDIFDDFVLEYNMAPVITKCKKTNIMEFRHNLDDEGNMNFFLL
jgi:hypothetical protein